MQFRSQFCSISQQFFFYQSCVAIAFTFLRNTPCQKVVTDGRNMSKDRQVFTEEILAIFDIFKPPGWDKQSSSLSLFLHHLSYFRTEALSIRDHRYMQQKTCDSWWFQWFSINSFSDQLNLLIASVSILDLRPKLIANHTFFGTPRGISDGLDYTYSSHTHCQIQCRQSEPNKGQFRITEPKFDQEYRDSSDRASDWLIDNLRSVDRNYRHTQCADCPHSLQSIVGKGACEPVLRTN